MRFIKFNTQAEAQVVCDRVFTSANNDGKFVPGTTAYAIPDHEEYFTVPVLDGFDSYFTQSELNGIEQFKEEKQGRLVIDDLLYQMKLQGLTAANMDTLLTTLQGVVVMLLAGHLRAARSRANTINTTTLYTSARKTWLLARIDTEIALL